MNEDNNYLINNHKVTLDNRQKISVTGIKKIISFDPLEFYLETTMGGLAIKGNDLELIKMDESSVSIKGTINSYNYIEERTKDNSFLTKLFK